MYYIDANERTYNMGVSSDKVQKSFENIEPVESPIKALYLHSSPREVHSSLPLILLCARCFLVSKIERDGDDT